jgi:hypothetical protein
LQIGHVQQHIRLDILVVIDMFWRVSLIKIKTQKSRRSQSDGNRIARYLAPRAQRIQRRQDATRRQNNNLVS